MVVWFWVVSAVAVASVVVSATVWKRRRDADSEWRAAREPVPGAEQWAGKRVCVVVNPIGGAGHGKRVFQNVLKPMLSQAGILIDLIGTPFLVDHFCIISSDFSLRSLETEYRGHAQRILAEVDLSKYSAVLSVSGDVRTLLNKVVLVFPHQVWDRACSMRW